MKSQDFLATVLPSSGAYCACEFSTVEKNRVFVDTIEETYNAAMSFSHSGYESFYALATFGNDVDDKGVRRRTAANALKIKSLFLDIDCGEGKDYPNKTEAAAALDKFLSETSLAELGTPWILSSGGGLHVYWAFEEEVDIVDWKPVAENLKRLCAKNGFKIDQNVTADAARVLRVPDTYNYKIKDKPRKVKIMVESNPQTFNFKTVAQNLREKMNGSAYELLQSSISLAGTKPKADATTNSVKLIENSITLFKNIERTTEPCLQLKHYEEHAANDGMEPLWYAWISIAKRCEDGFEYAKKLGDMHPYDEKRLTDKWNHSKGPTPCLKFDSLNPNVCEKCPHYGKITNPLALGRDVKVDNEAKDILISKENVPEQILISKPIPPKGFSYGAKGGIYIDKNVEDENGNKTKKPMMLLSYDLFVVDILFTEGEHYAHLMAMRPEGPVDVMLQQKSIISKDETLKTLASQNVIACYGGLDKELFYYVRAAVEHASTNKRPVKVPASYGWQEDGINDDGSLRYSSFVYNSRIYYPDGRIIFVPMPGLANINNACRPTGSFDAWKKAVDMLVAREFSDILTMGLIGPASLLMEFQTGINGMTYHMGSSESGTGKSLAQMLACSFFGSPNLYKLSQSTSPVAIQQRAGILRNFSIITDEVTTKSRNDFEWLPAHLMDKSQGKGKDRMESGANKERENTTVWKSIDLFSSNTHATDYLAGTRKHSSQAELLRILEMKMTVKIQLNDTEIDLVKSLSNNYGVAGDKLIRWMVTNIDTVKKVLEDTTLALKKEFNGTPDERFWTAGNGCIVTMAILLGKKYANIVDIPVKPVIESLRKMVEDSRKLIKGNKRTAEDILNSYTRENYGKFVVVKVVEGKLEAILGSGGTIDQSITRSQVTGRVEHDVTPNHIDYFIEEQQLRAHCVTMSYGYDDFKKEIEKLPNYKVMYKKKDMLGKTRGPQMRVNVMHICRPLEDDIFNKDD